MAKKLLLLASTFFLACHPLSVFNPPSVPRFKAQVIHDPQVTVAIDKYGIPFINAKSIEAALYGLGFMHARDRLFQLDVSRRAALGTLSEIFGDKTIKIDEQMRILTYRLDEQVANLTRHEHFLLDHYVRGVNTAAKLQGRSSEHFFLGVSFENFSKRDVVAIARLQSWTLAADLKTELAYLSFAHTKLPHELFYEVFSAVDDRGAAILAKDYPDPKNMNFFMPSYVMKRSQHAIKPKIITPPPKLDTGGSNAWVIHKDLSQDNVALLFNDPHLRHTLPGNFYLASLKTDTFFATGATFVGLPAILIGASPNTAWGVTASYTNAQDLVRLDMADTNSYIVDYKKQTLERWPQVFCIKNKKPCIEKEFYVSMFGPVIDKNYHNVIFKDELFSVMWTGFLVEKHHEIIGPFVKLAQAKTFKDSLSAVSAMTFPGINVVLAHTSGDIAYSFAGIIPKRDPFQNPHLPLDGARSSSLWPGLLAKNDTPTVINPAKNYLVTANQNIFSKLAPKDQGFGNSAAPPYRALRINQRIEDLIRKSGKLAVDDLKALQLDSTSVEALELAKPLGQICLDKLNANNKSQQEFARLIFEFDGNFTPESLGALPYYNLLATILAERYQTLFGSLAKSHQMDFAIKNALRKEMGGEPSAIFAKPRKHGILNYLGQMCEKSYNDLTTHYSDKPWQWRWGRHHYLKRQGVLANAPFIGTLFRDKKREVAGVESAPLAEAGLPVFTGANLRFVAKMTTPPQLSIVLDSGNSGHMGHKNALDQADLWHQGKSLVVETEWNQAQKDAVLQFVLP